MAHRYISKNIYELRKKRGWSQSDLAHKLDKKASTISSYETDSKTPSVDTIIAMALSCAMFCAMIEQKIPRERMVASADNRLLLLGHKPFDFGILISQIGHRTDLDHIAHLSLSYPYFIIILVKSKRLWKFHHEE